MTEAALDVFNEFATNEQAELDGVVVPYKGAEFLIAREGNPNYQRRFRELYDSQKLIIEMGGDAADKAAKDVSIQCLAETILKGWKNCRYQGKEIEYSVENAKKLLQHKEFRAWVMNQAYNIELYKAHKEAADLKN